MIKTMLAFIGTLHDNLTPDNELIGIIEKLNPSRLLVEIVQDDIEKDSMGSYPTEMRSAFAWATANYIEVYGIDSDIETLKKNTSQEELNSLNAEQIEIIKKHNWKDFNKTEFAEILDTKTWKKVINSTRNTERNIEMRNNIIHFMKDTGTTVVIIGVSHIPFMKSQFPGVQFPLA